MDDETFFCCLSTLFFRKKTFYLSEFCEISWETRRFLEILFRGDVDDQGVRHIRRLAGRGRVPHRIDLAVNHF